MLFKQGKLLDSLMTLHELNYFEQIYIYIHFYKSPTHSRQKQLKHFREGYNDFTILPS